MKITWLGHSCFKIESNKESLVFDPYKDESVDGLKPLRETADIVLCSHEHGDHNARECITTTNKETNFKISKIQTYHDDKQGILRGKNTIHIIDDGTYKVAHMGDIGCELTDEQIKQLKNVDILLIPIGGFFTIDARQAKQMMQQIQPKITIPMHYRSHSFGYEVLGTVNDFIKLFDSVKEVKENWIQVEDNLENPVIILSL